MHKLMLTVLVMGVSLGNTLGDVKCFLAKIADCSAKAGGQSLSAPSPGSDFCENIEDFMKCVRGKALECLTFYNFYEMERMIDDICTNGTFLNKRYLMYQDCILESVSAQHSCSQVIYDYVKKFKDLTPDTFFEIYKVVCRERHNIHQCLYDNLETDCGKDAKIFIEIISKPSERMNKKICGDVWRLDSKKPHSFISTLLNKVEP